MKLTTEHRILVGAIVALLVVVAQVVGTGAVSVIALELAEPAVARRAGGRLVRSVSAVPLAVTFPPDGNTPVMQRILIQTQNLCVWTRLFSFIPFLFLFSFNFILFIIYHQV